MVLKLRYKATMLASYLLLLLPSTLLPSLFMLIRPQRSADGTASGAVSPVRYSPLGWAGRAAARLRGSKPASPTHVRVLIRTHAKELLLLRSLIYGLRAQREAAGEWLRLDFVLVPTEPGEQETYRKLRRDLSEGFNDTLLLDVPDSFYAEAKAENPYTCTAADRRAYDKLGHDSTRRLCDQDHYMYFKVTDRALREFVVDCATCTHVLVTNGDNSYAPEFFSATVWRSEDLVVVGFTHDRHAMIPNIELGGIDMGAVLMRKRVFREGQNLFLTSLPNTTRAREVHDADFWFAKHAVESGMSHRILRDTLLMYHH